VPRVHRVIFDEKVGLMETGEQVTTAESPFPDNREHADTEIDQLYDAAMRRWAENNLPTVASWLDPMVADLAPAAFEQRPTNFTLPTLFADLLVAAGKNRLLHIEYETSPRRDLVARMFNYRARIMTLYPQVHFTQYIIVLGNGRVRGHDDLSNGFILDLRVIYLRERDPAEFLDDPVLAPLAVLARGRRERRERSFGAALRLIRDSGHQQTAELIQIAETLALVRLDPTTIARIRKENGMSIQPLVDHYKKTEVGHHLQRLGREEGREEGREKGREEAREKMLLAALRSRFGDVPESLTVVRRLAGTTDEAAMDAVLGAPTLQALLTADLPA
jgi:predicted transposase YdaD